MTRRCISVDTGLKIASRHPYRCADMLAQGLYPLLMDQPWFSKEWRLKFFAYFLQNLADQSIEEEVDQKLLMRVRRMPLKQAIRLMGRATPCSGLKVLVALICQELRVEQRLSIEEQYHFYTILFGKLLPEPPREVSIYRRGQSAVASTP